MTGVTVQSSGGAFPVWKTQTLNHGVLWPKCSRNLQINILGWKRLSFQVSNGRNSHRDLLAAQHGLQFLPCPGSVPPIFLKFSQISRLGYCRCPFRNIFCSCYLQKREIRGLILGISMCSRERPL